MIAIVYFDIILQILVCYVSRSCFTKMDSSKDNNVLPVDEHQIDELAVQHNGLPVLDEKSSECDGHPEGENQADDLAIEKDDALLIDECKLAL